MRWSNASTQKPTRILDCPGELDADRLWRQQAGQSADAVARHRPRPAARRTEVEGSSREAANLQRGPSDDSIQAGHHARPHRRHTRRDPRLDPGDVPRVDRYRRGKPAGCRAPTRKSTDASPDGRGEGIGAPIGATGKSTDGSRASKPSHDSRGHAGTESDLRRIDAGAPARGNHTRRPASTVRGHRGKPAGASNGGQAERGRSRTSAARRFGKRQRQAYEPTSCCSRQRGGSCTRRKRCRPTVGTSDSARGCSSPLPLKRSSTISDLA